MDIFDTLKSISGQDGLGWFVEVTTESGRKFVQRNWLNPNRAYSGLIGEYRIDFWWHFNTTPAANHGRCVIYNLTPENIALFRKGEHITIQAGWQPTPSPAVLTIKGTIIRVDEFVEDRAGTTRGTVIRFLDSPEYILAKVTSHWWPPNTPYTMIFLDLVRDLGLPLKVFKPVIQPIARTGYSVLGRIWPEMQLVAKNLESKLHCYNREIYLLPPQEGVPTGFTWTPQNGLHNVQKRVEVSHDGRNKIYWEKHEPATLRAIGLLEPHLSPDAIVNIQNLTTLPEAAGRVLQGKAPLESGVYRVVSGTHYCDNQNLVTEVFLAPYGEVHLP